MSFKIYCSNGHANESVGGAKPTKCKKCNISFSAEASVPTAKLPPPLRVVAVASPSRPRGYNKGAVILDDDANDENDSVNDIPEIDGLSFEVETNELSQGRPVTLDTAMFGMSKPFSQPAKKAKLSKAKRQKAYNNLMDSIKSKTPPGSID